MAIKGKKKQQSRGSQARRRPATAPRPPAVIRRTPWYRTDRGRLVAGVIAVVVLGGAWWVVANARANAARLERKQAQLADYTGRVGALLQAVRPAAGGMVNAPAASDEKGVEALAHQAQSWVETLQSAHAQTGAPLDAAEVANANNLYAHAISIYTSAARTYQLVPEAKGALRVKLLERAAAQRDDAGVVWLAATEVLDDERARAGLGASGIGAPASPALGAAPSPPPPQGEGQDGGGNAGGGRSSNDGAGK